MSIFYNKETNEYPLHIGDVNILHPAWEDTMAVPEPFVIVEYQEHPLLEFNQEVVSEEVVFENNVYKNKWTIRELSEYEVLKKTEELEKLKSDPNSPFYVPVIDNIPVDPDYQAVPFDYGKA